MGKIETKLKKMGLEIPPTHPYPSPNRTSAVQAGNLLFLSGHGTGRSAMPLNIKQFGKVGGDVPYKGGGPALAELIGGQVKALFSLALAATPQIKAGKVPALAITSAQRPRARRMKLSRGSMAILCKYCAARKHRSG